MATRQIPWARVLVEGVVIVVSILLALAGDAWWDERQDRAEERELLVAIHGDLIANQDLLARNIRDVEAAMRQLQDFVAMSPEGLSALPDSVDASILWGLTRPWTTELALGSLEATISSGKLALIRDSSVRAALVSSTKLDADLGEPRSFMTQITADAIHEINRHPELAEQYSVTTGGRTLSSASLAAVRSDSEVMAFATDKIMAMNSYLIQSQRALERLKDTADLVEAELEARP